MKAQISIEYITFVGIILLILSLASYAALMAGKGVGEENELIEARNVATTLAYEINLASEIGAGYSHKFYLPPSVLGYDYFINISENSFVKIGWNGKSYMLPVVSHNITNNARKGENVIRNLDGVITFD